MSRPVEDVPTLVPIEALSTFTPRPSEFLIEQLLPADVVTLLAAHGGTGKTRLSLQAAICIAMGLPFLGKSTIRAKVLFYSAEDDADQLQRMIHELCVKLSVDPKELALHLHVVDASEADSILFTERFENGVRRGMTTPAFEHLKNMMGQSGATVLVVDNASDVYGADENNRTLVRAFIRALTRIVRPIHGAVLLLSHVDKFAARTKSGEGYSGSTAWHNSARSRLVLTTNNEGVVLEQQKSNRGAKAEPILLVWDGRVLVSAAQGPIQSGTQAMAESLALARVLDLIDEFYRRGEYISTGTSAHSNAFKMLACEPTFPKTIRKANQLWPLLRDAERAGRLERETYQSAQRKPLERWRVIPFALSAPSALSPNEGASHHESAEGAPSAPSCVGGTGDGAAHAPSTVRDLVSH